MNKQNRAWNNVYVLTWPLEGNKPNFLNTMCAVTEYLIISSLCLVNRFHKGEVTPVVTDVSRFMETLLNDCSGEIPDNDSDFPPYPEEMSFLVLRVLIINQLSQLLYFWILWWVSSCQGIWLRGAVFQSNTLFFISRLLVSWVKPYKLSAPAWFPLFCGVLRKQIFHYQTKRLLYRPLGWWISMMRYNYFTHICYTLSLYSDGNTLYTLCLPILTYTHINN